MGYVPTPIAKCVTKVSTWNPRQEQDVEAFPYVDLSSVNKETKSIALEDVPVVSPAEAPSRARQLIATGDVLVSTVRPNLNGVALVSDLFDGATASTGYCVLRPDPKKLDSRYLFYWVQTPHFVESMMKQATGANYPAVSDRVVKRSEIPLPPLAEQQRIAAILDKADALRRKRQQAIDLADQFLRSVFLDMFGDPVTNPKGWRTCSMRELIHIRGGFAFKSTDFVESGIPVVKIGNANKLGFTAKKIDFIRPENPTALEQYELYPGDLLMSLTGTVGKDDYANITEVSNEYERYYLNQRVAKITVDLERITKSYLKFFLAHPRIKAEITKNNRGVRQANISNGDIYGLDVPIPNTSTLEIFDRIVSKSKALNDAMCLGPLVSEELFKSLSQKAFRGEL